MKQDSASPQMLLDACLEAHMQNSGTLDPQPDYLQVIEFIQNKLDKWQPSPSFTLKFDNTVKALALAALEEHKERNEYYKRKIS